MTWRTWREAWQDSLYGEDGFYRQPAGPAAQFATSAQGIPGGGALLAAAVIALATAHGCRSIVDLGAGRGELLSEIAVRAPQFALTGVDVVARPDTLPPGVDWLRSPGGPRLPADLAALSDALVIAHEWLDVVPCEIAEYDGGRWRVVEVDESGAERLADPVGRPEEAWLLQHWAAPQAPGERAEVGRARDRAFARLRDRVRSGLLVAVDYGHLRCTRPRHGTLTGYRQGVQVAARPDGSTDITAHVAMDTLGADRVVSQRDLFNQLSLGTPAAPVELAHSDPAAYLRQVARRSTYTQLTARGGLGDFWWAISSAGAGSR